MTWTRADHRDRLAAGEIFDVLIIGGGIVGCGAALDAASRGLTVAIIDQEDFGSGTSSRSTKLLHGGIRYLPHFEFGLVAEGLIEQKTLAKTADFLFRDLEFLMPMYEGRKIADLPRWASHPAVAPSAMKTGLMLYDLLGLRGLGAHRSLSNEEMIADLPGLIDSDLTGGFGYRDAQTDDVRLTITIMKTAVTRYGAVGVNHMKAVGTEPTDEGWVTTVLDDLDGESFAVRSHTVIAATGPSAPPIDGHMPVRLSSGVHLVIHHVSGFPGDKAVLLPETDDGRVMFVVPWQGHLLLGTTDVPYDDDPAAPRPTADEVDYLLRHFRMYFDLPDAEVLSAFSGLRALTDDGGSTADASRGHEIREIASGFVQVAGGKLTTYRRIAAEVVDELDDSFDFLPASGTRKEMLVGAGQPEDVAKVIQALSEAGIDVPAEIMWSRYGQQSLRLVEQLDGAFVLGDGQTVSPAIAWAARHEGAATIGDFALRRSHLAWFTEDHGRSDAPAIGEILAKELNWSTDQVEAQAARFSSDLAREGL